MSNDELFKALSCKTRLEILKILSQKEMHVSGIAKELKISVPVTARHIKILEKVGMLNKRIIGNIHLLSVKNTSFEKALDPFASESEIDVEKNESLFSALKQVPGIKVKKIGNNQYIQAIDGDDGYYIYEINGKTPNKPIEKYKINKDLTLDLKKIVSVKKKKIKINIKDIKE